MAMVRSFSSENHRNLYKRHIDREANQKKVLVMFSNVKVVTGTSKLLFCTLSTNKPVTVYAFSVWKPQNKQ